MSHCCNKTLHPTCLAMKYRNNFLFLKIILIFNNSSNVKCLQSSKNHFQIEFQEIQSENLTLVRGIKTFEGIGRSDEIAYCRAAESLVCVKRVPSTKSANQNGRGKSSSLSRPHCGIKIQGKVQGQPTKYSQIKCSLEYLQCSFIFRPTPFHKYIIRKPHRPTYDLHRAPYLVNHNFVVIDEQTYKSVFDRDSEKYF